MFPRDSSPMLTNLLMLLGLGKLGQNGESSHWQNYRLRDYSFYLSLELGPMVPWNWWPVVPIGEAGLLGTLGFFTELAGFFPPGNYFLHFSQIHRVGALCGHQNLGWCHRRSFKPHGCHPITLLAKGRRR